MSFPRQTQTAAPHGVHTLTYTDCIVGNTNSFQWNSDQNVTENSVYLKNQRSDRRNISRVLIWFNPPPRHLHPQLRPDPS